MDPNVAALAGLLHDIGKFWQRAASSAAQKLPPGYEKYTKDDFGQNGTHAAWSAAFVEQYLPETLREATWSAVFFHHNPSDERAELIALADRLSAGERQPINVANPKRLQSVFCELSGETMPPQYWPLRPLEMDGSVIFPTANAAEDTQDRDAYKMLWSDFAADAAALQPITDLTTYLESLLAIVMRYCWCIPSAYYRNVPDISLFDHSRTTGALAAVLAAGSNAGDVSRLLKKPDDTPIATLIEGDISGVQHFIYTITAKGAAKGLRARSLYLQLLSEAAARFLLREMGMPITNLLYVGGGHFYLLAPAGKSKQVATARKHLSDFMLTHHDGNLYMALGTREISAREFAEPDAFSSAWADVGKSTSADKRRRYADLSPEVQMMRVFSPRAYSEGDELGRRRIEREEGSENERSEFSRSLHEFGGHTGRASGLVLAFVDAEQRTPDDMNAALSQLGIVALLVDADGELLLPLPTDYTYHRAVLLGTQAFLSNDACARVAHTLSCEVARGLRYTVNVIPQRSDYGVATFSDLQMASEGLKRFGVLRMDVDDLGQLFARGFVKADETSQATLSRVASLSFALSLYFEGWVGQLCQQVNAERWKPVRDGGKSYEVQPIYTVYSGGDDLFIVGAWDELTGLAERIQGDLSRFACGNPNVHVSGGITLHGGKYPLYQAAEAAEHALDAAKALDGKNAITFLGQPVTWGQWQLVREIHGDLMHLHANKVPRSLFQMLMSLYREYETAREAMNTRRTKNNERQIVWGSWMWHSAYQIRRLADRHKPQRDPILALQEDMMRDNFEGIRYVGIAARWADALTRSERDEHKE